MNLLKKLAAAFAPAATEPVISGHTTRFGDSCRTRSFVQADDFTLDALLDTGVENRIYYEAFKSRDNAQVWYVRPVGERVTGGETFLDYGPEKKLHPRSFEDAMNELATFEKAQAEVYKNKAEPLPQNSGQAYFKTLAEKEGFAQDAAGYILRADEEGRTGTFRQSDLVRAKEQRAEALAQTQGLFATMFHSDAAQGSLQAALARLNIVSVLESGYFNQMHELAAELRMSRNLDSNYDLGYNSKRKFKLLSRTYLAHKAYDAYSGDYECYLKVKRDDKARFLLNQMLDFAHANPGSILSADDQAKFKAMTAVIAIETLTRISVDYFRQNISAPNVLPDVNDRIALMHDQIKQMKDRYFPDLDPAILAKVESTIMSPEASFSDCAIDKAVAGFDRWKKELCDTLPHAQSADKPEIGNAAISASLPAPSR